MLYGFLGAEFGRVHRYDVKTPAQAVRALCATIKGFKQALIEGEHYRVVVGGKSSLELDQVFNPVSDRESIRIVPIVAGSGGLGKILLGVALVVASVYTSGAASGFFSTTAGGFVSAAAGKIGFALVLGGVSELLFKPPSAPDSAEKPDSRPSFIFNGAVNTSTEGNAVPVLYGSMIVGSQVVSVGLSVEQI